MPLALVLPAAETAPKVPPAVQDAFVPAKYGDQRIAGLLGARMDVNLRNRLLRDVDLNALLAGYRKRPGQQTWIGEHAPKFIDAATNTWRYSGDAQLKAKLDEAVTSLVAAQLPDGYLGTYLEADRWRDWDLWAHKYNLLALLNYYGQTGYASALETCRKAADLLIKSYGDGPGQRDIVLNDWHVGMANTSVLEGMVLLYRHTGEARYLEFCRYIVRAWDHPKGPRLLTTLMNTGSVRRVANNKAYEMLSNLVGLAELYRATGDATYLKPAVLAWKDIRDKRLYLSGSSSWDEHFPEDHVLRADDLDEDAGVGEGCVTTTWFQLSLNLLRLTGEAQYAEEIERTAYNALTAAQHPGNGTICYFVPLNGKKRYGAVSQGVPGVSCCTSSIARGLSLLPAAAWGRRGAGIAVNLYAPGAVKIALGEAAAVTNVTLLSRTDYPASGTVELEIQADRQARFPVYLRVPAWTAAFTAVAGGATFQGRPGSYLEIQRNWTHGDRIRISMDLTTRVHSGAPSYPGAVAIQRGPQLLALDSAANPEMETWLAGVSSAAPVLKEQANSMPKGWLGSQSFRVEGFTGNQLLGRRPASLVLVPLADAGQVQGSEYRVWLAAPPARRQ